MNDTRGEADADRLFSLTPWGRVQSEESKGERERGREGLGVIKTRAAGTWAPGMRQHACPKIYQISNPSSGSIKQSTFSRDAHTSTQGTLMRGGEERGRVMGSDTSDCDVRMRAANMYVMHEEGDDSVLPLLVYGCARVIDVPT